MKEDGYPISVLNKKSVIRMGTELYNTVPDDITEMDIYKAFKKEKSFLLYHAFYSVEEFASL
jgi:hypothetical protein